MRSEKQNSPFRNYGVKKKRVVSNPGVDGDGVYASMANDDEAPLAPWMTDRSLLPRKPPGRQGR